MKLLLTTREALMNDVKEDDGGCELVDLACIDLACKVLWQVDIT